MAINAPTSTFSSLALSQSRGPCTADGVRSTAVRDVQAQGMLASTSNPRDIAIGGRGMLPVTQISALDNPDGALPMRLTATGSFRPDKDGYLRTSSGLVLLGWKVDIDGDIPTQPRDSSAGLQPVEIYAQRFAASPTTKIELGVNLPATATQADGAGGSILSVSSLSGGSYDPLTGMIDITVDGGPLDIEIGMLGSSNRLTQLSAEFAPTSVTKNGAPVGTLTSVEVDENGYVNAIYDAGFIRRILQIPVADVPNLNGLAAEDNQAFSLTQASGSLYLWNAGDGPTGGMTGCALQESTADIAGALTDLMQTHRACSFQRQGHSDRG